MKTYFNEILFICFGKELPPSVNSLYRMAGKKLYKPVKAVAWEETFEGKIRALKKNIPLFTGNELYALFCWWSDRADVDNRLKSSMDAMNGLVYKDDSCLKALLSMKIKGKKGFLFCVSSELFLKKISPLFDVPSCEKMADLLVSGEL